MDILYQMYTRVRSHDIAFSADRTFTDELQTSFNFTSIHCNSSRGLHNQPNSSYRYSMLLTSLAFYPLYTRWRYTKKFFSLLLVGTIPNNSSQQFNYSVDSPYFWVENSNGKGMIKVKRLAHLEACLPNFDNTRQKFRNRIAVLFLFMLRTTNSIRILS